CVVLAASICSGAKSGSSASPLPQPIQLFLRSSPACSRRQNKRGERTPMDADARIAPGSAGKWSPAQRARDTGSRLEQRDDGTQKRVSLSIKTVSVCGLGKLGSCIGATLAARGFEVVGVDIDPEKVSKINDGLAPLDEPLLAETIQAGHSRLRATLDAREAVATDATFFIPPSPSLPDGSFSNEFLLKAMQPVAKAIKDAGKKGHLFVCSSTTTPGAMDAVLIPMLERELGGICGKDFGVCYNPEFIALGDVINGLLEPDLVLIGESDPESGAALEQLYK